MILYESNNQSKISHSLSPTTKVFYFLKQRSWHQHNMFSHWQEQFINMLTMSVFFQKMDRWCQVFVWNFETVQPSYNHLMWLSHKIYCSSVTCHLIARDYAGNNFNLTNLNSNMLIYGYFSLKRNAITTCNADCDIWYLYHIPVVVYSLIEGILW